MFVKELTKRQIQAQNTKDLIYKTAIEMMEQKGFQNIKVEEICKVAGVSVGSFYNCFKSKNEILDEVFKHIDNYYLHTVADKLKAGSACDRIITFFEIYAAYNVERGIEFVKQLFGVKNNLFITKGRYLQTALQDIIQDGHASGEFNTEMTAEETVEFMFVAIRGVVYHWCLHDGSFDLVEYTSNYTKQLLKTIVA